MYARIYCSIRRDNVIRGKMTDNRLRCIPFVWVYCILCVSVQLANSARFQDVPCATVAAVHAGAYSFTVDVAVQRVRSLRCVLVIEVSHIPARGSRHGARATTTCFADGLGCIALDPPVKIVIDVDLPTYERTVVEVPILSQFDDDARSVPFTHLSMQVAESEHHFDQPKRPQASWVPRLTGFSTTDISNRKGMTKLAQSQTEKLISIFSQRSSFIAQTDETLSPRVMIDPSRMQPTVRPHEMMQLIHAGGRTFDIFRVATKHWMPWVNDTHILPEPIRVVIPLYKEVVLDNAKAIATIDRLAALGITDDAVLLAHLYNVSTGTLFFDNIEAEVFVGDEELGEINRTILDRLFFPLNRMRIRVNPSGLGVLSKLEWEAIIGHTESAWENIKCEGSTQCSLTGISIATHERTLTRTMPLHVSSSAPTCMTMRPRKPAAEVAQLRVGVKVVSHDLTHAHVNTRVRLSSAVELHDVYADDDQNGMMVRILTGEDSVPGFIAEPSDSLYMLNCFAHRGKEHALIEDENPYIRSPTLTAMALLEHQRGVLVLPNARTDHNLGSGCGSMNFGMGFWRHVANRMQHAAYNISKHAVDYAPGKFAHHHHEADFASLHAAFSYGGHACIPTGTCSDYNPATLFADEMTWLRGKGVLPPRFPKLNPDAPALVDDLRRVNAYAGTPKEQANFLLKDMIPNIKKEFPTAVAGCGHPTGKPMTMAGGIWNHARQNMWVASNRQARAEARKLYIEDTHVHMKGRITHGVSFNMHTELKLAHFPHVDVTINDTGCVYLPATTMKSDPDIACKSTDPRLAGTAFADIVLARGEKYRELILVVECIGPAFCPLWETNMSVLTDAETGEVVPANITTHSDWSPYPLRPVLTHFLDRLLQDGVIGHYGEPDSDSDSDSTGVNAKTVYDRLEEFPLDGPVLAEHLIFRFNQTASQRKYAWEAQGGGTTRGLLPDRFTRNYFVQLYSGGLHHAISDTVSFDCHQSDRCKKRPSIPPQCIPIPPVVKKAQDINAGSPPREDCGFFQVSCQIDNKDTQFLWAVLATFQVVVIGTVLVVVWRRRTTLQSRHKMKEE